MSGSRVLDDLCDDNGFLIGWTTWTTAIANDNDEDSNDEFTLVMMMKMTRRIIFIWCLFVVVQRIYLNF